jgi:membrane protease YdiL (CAAX protease family)
VQEPQFELSPERRFPDAWVALILVLAVLFTVALSSYLSLASAKTDAGYEVLDQTLRFEMLRGAISEEFGAISTKSTDKSSAQIPSRLASAKDHDPDANKLYTAIRYQEGRKVTPETMAPILHSIKPETMAFVQVYSATKLTPARAQELADQMPSDSVAYQLAKVHAYKKAGMANPYLRVVHSWKVGLFLTMCGLVLLGGCVGFILVIVYVAMRTSGTLKPRGHPAEPLSPGRADVFAARSFHLLLAFIGIQLLPLLIFKRGSIGPEIMTPILMILAVPLVSLIPYYGQRVTLREQGWRTDNLLSNIGWAVGGACAMIPIFLIVTLVSANLFSSLPAVAHPEITRMQSANPLTMLLIGIGASIMAPIFEETVFRGTILPAFSARFRNVTAGILVSSLCFAMMHSTGPGSWLQLGSVGAVSAVLIYQTKSIIPSVLLHAAFNTGMLLMVIAFG